MIESFGNKAAMDIWEKNKSKTLPEEFHDRAKALLTIMHAVSKLDELIAMSPPPSLRVHMLKGNRKGTFALDINKVSGWRITFKLKGGNFSKVQIENYHED